MGACASTCRAWREDAENDEEVRGVPLQQEQAQQASQDHLHHWLHHHDPNPLPPLALPGGAPSTYVPLSTPLAIIGGPATFVPSPDRKAAAAAAAAASTQNGGGGGGVHRSPSEVQLFFRASQELSMAHLVRHPRLQPFHAGVGRFGLGNAYEPLKLLGRGGTGQTWLCREAASGKLYALKLQERPIPRNTVKLAYNEITIQASTCVSSVHSTHICEALLTPTHLALVLDYEAGGSAAEFVAKQIPRVSRHDLIVEEDFARFAFRQLVLGLEHLHDNHVAHRDVKLDNTLLDGEQLPTVKLCDFQFAKYWGKPQLTRTKTHLGTAVYMSPELIENRQTHKAYDPVEVDVWAAGIWLAALLFGAFIYDNRPGADDTAAEMQILQQELDGPWHSSRFVRPYVHLLSPELRDLLSQILHNDPASRVNMEGIKAHPWMARPLPQHLEAAWQRVRRAQLQLEHRLAALTPNNDRVQQRNSRVYDLVREAAAPLDRWQQSYQRFVKMCEGSQIVDCSSIHGTLRIDMQPEAVASQLGQRALALLDTDASTSPPGTPKRFSLPLTHVASDQSLSAMAGGSDSGANGGAGGAGAQAEALSQLSPFAAAAAPAGGQ